MNVYDFDGTIYYPDCTVSFALWCANRHPKECTAGKKRKKSAPNTEYLKGHYDYIRVNVPKGEREKIKAYAESQGMSVNKLLLTALEEYQKNH